MALTWIPLRDYVLTNQPFAEPWAMVCEQFPDGAKYLKFQATGNWFPLDATVECGPDGLVGQTFPEDRLLLTDCSLGALIGRIGGGSASLKASAASTEAGQSAPFAVGQYAIIKLPEKAVGPLFLGLNTLFRPVPLDSLSVSVNAGL